ncbi:hypothetical protein CHS0354_001028 [Potamilus streckersoni]|uniref:Immunoglobulin V-set domain-containing protein n=1 Tax=Potamilus streckersoni TaxID=2493646 RepID=A0AAE0SUS2_9BIVA|nr:hypothetical protein CHS0354_001028 [Potamilus streckersoni]
MTVNRSGKFLSALAIGFCMVIAAGFECPVAKDPIIFIGGNMHSVIFMWDCSLLPNETVLGVIWIKENTTIAIAEDNRFTPQGSYAGRVERNGTFGILLHNISVKDSGHYNISVLLNYSLKESNAPVTACQSAYLPALPEELWKYYGWKHQLSPTDEAMSFCGQEGLSKLEIGLICGLTLVAISAIVLVFLFYRKRRNTMQREDTGPSSPEESQTL